MEANVNYTAVSRTAVVRYLSIDCQEYVVKGMIMLSNPVHCLHDFYSPIRSFSCVE